MEKIKATVELTIFNCLFPIILFEVDHKNCLKRNRDKSSAFNGVGGEFFGNEHGFYAEDDTNKSSA